MSAAMMDDGRTVVVSGVPRVPDVLSDRRMVDKLTIHFQSSKRSRGGDVEGVVYPTKMEGVAFVTFDRAKDAEKVVKKEQHILMDDELSDKYHLSVFPFSRDVFLYVPSATVDLSMFGGDQASLIKSLQSAHRSIRFSSLLQQRKAIIEGPFSAIKALREDLIQRASRLQPSARSAAVQPNSSMKTKQASASQESSDEPRKVQKPKSQRDSPGQREHFAGGNFSKEDEEDLKAQRSSDISLNYGRTKSSVRQVVGEESNARVVSSLSSRDPHPVEEKSAKQPRRDSFLEKQSRSGGTSAAKAREEEHLGSRSDYLKDLSNSKLNDSEGNNGLHPGDLEDFWVDLYTFKYIQKFDQEELDRCFKGLSMDTSIKCVEGDDLMQLSLTEKQPAKSASRLFQTGLEKLQILTEFWQSNLRVHEIPYSKADKPKLTRLCGEANSRFPKVLYVFEDSCVKIIGPSSRSHLFWMVVRDGMSL